MARFLPRRGRMLLAIATVTAALVFAGCESRALMAPDGSAIYWGTNTGTPKRLSTATLSNDTLPILPDNLRGGMMSPDGNSAYVITEDGVLTALDIPAGSPRTSTTSGLGSLNGIPLTAISPTGTTAILGSTSDTTGVLHKIDLSTMTRTGSGTIAAGEVFAETGAFTPDGANLLVGLNTTNLGVAKVRVPDLTIVGHPIDLTPTAVGFLTGVVLSPDGLTGYAVGQGAMVRFDVATMTVTGELRYPATLGIQNGSLMRSPDGARLYFVTVTTPTQLHAIDLEGLRELETREITDLVAPNPDEYWAVLSPDGTTVFVGESAGDAVRVPVATRRTLEVTVAGRGSVRTSTRTTCAPTCSETLLDYQTVTLTAVPGDNATFGGWGGACSGSATTCTLAMEQARSVTATFVDDPVPPANPRLSISSTKARTTAARVIFTTRLTASEAGMIAQRVVLRSRVGTRAERTLCRATKTLTRAGSATIVCRSSLAARRLLERRSLRVSVITTLRTDDGRTRQATRHLRLVRSAPSPTPPVTG